VRVGLQLLGHRVYAEAKGCRVLQRNVRGFRSARIRVQRACGVAFIGDHGTLDDPSLLMYRCTLRARLRDAESAPATVRTLFRKPQAFTMQPPLSERNGMPRPGTQRQAQEWARCLL